ncbi:MAG: FAD-binding oxidoreductase [Verrucomicrobia bacterium]|nr:FAD-binding oxidoreductase [Verrucomicrobiota bacterium]
MAGFVANRAELALPRSDYEVALVGGGLIGLAAAAELMRRAPQTRALIVEQGGIPSEEGATQYSPGLHHAFFDDAELRHRARRWREELHALTAAFPQHGRIFEPVGVLSFEPGHVELAQRHPEEFALLDRAEIRRRWPLAEVLVDLSVDRCAAWDEGAGFVHVEALAYAYGMQSVRAGADLCLNARAAWDRGGRLRLERLTVNNRMEVVVAGRTDLQAERLLIAAGAPGLALAEQHFGEVVPVEQCLMQYPRLDRDPAWPLAPNGRLALPVLLDAGFALRPHHDGLVIVPPLLPPDPAGYVATGGRFLGVPVGLRREHLSQISRALERLPALSLPTLNPGRTPWNLRRAHEVLTPQGRPVEHAIADTPHVVRLGGSAALALGPWP